MKGRGVRVFSPDKLRAVTPSAKAKDRFIIVDAVGVCEQDKTESTPLDRQHSATLEQLLDHVAKGGTHPDVLTTLASRLARLQREFTAPQLAELTHLAGGKSLGDLAHDLLRALDPDAQLEAAKRLPGAATPPTAAQVNSAAEQLAHKAVEPLLKAALRRRILEIRAANEQTLDRHNLDELLHAAFDAQAQAKAQTKVKDLRQWMQDHRHELTALQALYAGTRPLKLSLADLRKLKEALTLPPVAASPAALWRAFTVAEAPALADAAVKPQRGGDQLADLVTLLRHALKPELPLVPYADEVRQRYAAWRHDQAQAGARFSTQQSEWLDRIAEHIATSLSIEPDDFGMGWFGQHGGLGQAHGLFGHQLQPLLAELNERLAA
jgi:type I restriction enzyme R subunit